MIDHLHAVADDRLTQLRRVEHRAEHADKLRSRKLGAHRVDQIGDLVLDLVERGFRDIQQHDAARSLLQELTDELGSDGAAGAGDEDRLAARLARQEIGIGRNLVAAEKVVDLDGAQVGDAHAAGSDVLDRRQHLHLDGLVLQILEDAPPLAPPVVRHGNENLFHLVTGDKHRQLVGMMNLQAGDVLAPQGRLGIDEGDGRAIVAAAQGLQQLHAEMPGTEDDDRRTLDVGGKLGEADAGALQDHGGHLAAAGDEQRRENTVAEHDRARDAELARHEHDQRPDQHRQPDTADDARVAAVAEIARDEAVQPGHGERHDGEEGPAEEHQRRVPIGRHVGGVVADGDGDPQRQGKKQEIERDEDDALVEARQLEQPRTPLGRNRRLRSVFAHSAPDAPANGLWQRVTITLSRARQKHSRTKKVVLSRKHQFSPLPPTFRAYSDARPAVLG